MVAVGRKNHHHLHRSSSLCPRCFSSLGRTGFALVGTLALALCAFHFASNYDSISMSDVLLLSSNSLTQLLQEQPSAASNNENTIASRETRILYKPRPFQTKDYHNNDNNSNDKVVAAENREKYKETWTPVARPPKLDGFITRHDSVAGDPLRDSSWNATAFATNHEKKPLPFAPKTDYLGVLVDAGRHYYPIPWMYNLIDRLHDLKYNLVHFRLTDDQAWNVLLEQTPSLAYPSHVDNPQGRVYTVPEIRALVAYGKTRNVYFMPEINVPGHGGSWAAALNGTAIVQCPRFICKNGYGIPINVTHPAIFPLLETVLREIIDIFDDPPFLHLGGDEVNMAGPCFQEVHEPEPDYQLFEQRLEKVVETIGYPQDRIVRWEMTGQANLQRVGKMQQYWFGFPQHRVLFANPNGDTNNNNNNNTATEPPVQVERYMLSTHMYFDTNGEEDAHDVYFHAIRAFDYQHQKPVAIVAATFELSPTFWFDRNILGRLLAVSMGAAQIHLQENITISMNQHGVTDHNFDYRQVRVQLNAKYTEYCNMLGLGPTICNTNGGPVVPTHVYKEKWNRAWDVWKQSICHRLTDASVMSMFRDNRHQSEGAKRSALDYFANNFASTSATIGINSDNDDKNDRAFFVDGIVPEPWTSLGRHDKDKVPEFAGIILDLTTSRQTTASELEVIFKNAIARVGLNTVQLRLAGKTGGWFSYDSNELKEIDDKASKLGLHVIPEMSVSSDANGYHALGIVAQCAAGFCREGVPVDISEKTAPLTVFSLIGMLQEDFPKSRFLHLGSDERLQSLPCLYSTKTAWHVGLSDFDAYEYRLSRMLQLDGKIEMDHILRWENAEHEHYPERTGDITHYRSGTDIGKIRKNDGPFFVTVDVVRKDESAWSLYQHTRLLVDTKPMGIMAEVGTVDFEGWYGGWEMPQRK
jgi:Glycosyl hydrolase family 20, catalytic domain